jgi:uncharacterized phage-associated protein
MPYTVRQIADFFITLANDEKFDDNIPEWITHLKLQKILYFAQSAFLAMDRWAVFNEKIEAWKYWPVIPEIYQIFKWNTGLLSLEDRNFDDFSIIALEDQSLLKDIWEEFWKYSAKKLVDITHDHAPWKYVYMEWVPNIEITQDSLRVYYSGMFSIA